jgi:hypothetical protein
LPVRWLGSARPGSRLTSSRRAALAHKGSSSSCCVVRAVQPLRAKTALLLLLLLLLLLPRFFGMFFLSFCCAIRAHAYATRRDITCGVVRTGPSDRHGRTTESGADGASVSLEAALPKHDPWRFSAPPRPQKPASRRGTPHQPPSSSVLRRLTPRPRLAMSDFFGVVFIQARVVIFIIKCYLNGNRIDQGT